MFHYIAINTTKPLFSFQLNSSRYSDNIKMCMDNYPEDPLSCPIEVANKWKSIYMPVIQLCEARGFCLLLFCQNISSFNRIHTYNIY